MEKWLNSFFAILRSRKRNQQSLLKIWKHFLILPLSENRMNYLGRWVPRHWVCLSRRPTVLCEGCFRSDWCSRWRSWIRKCLMFPQPYLLWNMFVIRFFLSHKENKIKRNSYISKIQLKFSICILKHGLSRSITIISMLSLINASDLIYTRVFSFEYFLWEH